jgi:hypothetical protein
MSAQINLYHPRFLKQREWLVLGKVVLAAGALYIMLALVGGWLWRDAAARKEAAAATEAQLLSIKEQADAATKAAAESKPDAQLIADLGNAEALLRRRGDIARLLESGAIGSAGGFSDYLRGFARQKPDSLWLTGFTIGAGGNDMEIRGSMLNPAALPDYIRRLGTEKVFQGRSFAALTLNRAEPAPTAQAVGAAAGLEAAPFVRPIDFILMPKLAEAKEAGS